MGQDGLIAESDVRQIVRLLGEVAQINGLIAVKKRALMEGLSHLVEADAWSWIISRAETENHNPAVGSYLYGGITDQEFGLYARMMQDRKNVPVEYAALNSLRLTHKRFTRSWDQLVKPDEWYGPRNERLIRDLGFEHIMYSVWVLDDDGMFSGICLKHRAGRPKFTPRQRRIVHIVTGEVDWLHYDENLARVTREVRPLAPHLRTVLTLLIDGKSVKEIAGQLALSHHTVAGYTKDIHRHFHVSTRSELLRHFMAGDGADVE